LGAASAASGLTAINHPSLVLQGAATEQVLLAAATRPISLFELEEQLAAMDQQAYQRYLVGGLGHATLRGARRLHPYSRSAAWLVRALP
jgi:hypothetical protein